MRLMWTFLAGVVLAGLALVATAPFLAGAALVGWLARGELWTVLSGQSYFAARDEDGRTAGRLVNVSFHPVSVALAGDPRPRPLLARLQVDTTEFSAASADGRVRLDVWPMGGAADLHKPPLYTVMVPGRGASLEADGMMMVERGARRSAFSLADGSWLFDADAPVAVFAVDGERRRYVALAQAEDDLAAGAVAVLSYATPRRVIRRVVLSAADPARGRFLRGTLNMTRPVTRVDDKGGRVLEVPLPSGALRLPVAGDDLDVAHAEVPAGMRLDEIRPWGGTVSPSPPTTGGLPAVSTPGRGR